MTHFFVSIILPYPFSNLHVSYFNEPSHSPSFAAISFFLGIFYAPLVFLESLLKSLKNCRWNRGWA